MGGVARNASGVSGSIFLHFRAGRGEFVPDEPPRSPRSDSRHASSLPCAFPACQWLCLKRQNGVWCANRWRRHLNRNQLGCTVEYPLAAKQDCWTDTQSTHLCDSRDAIKIHLAGGGERCSQSRAGDGGLACSSMHGLCQGQAGHVHRRAALHRELCNLSFTGWQRRACWTASVMWMPTSICIKSSCEMAAP